MYCIKCNDENYILYNDEFLISLIEEFKNIQNLQIKLNASKEEIEKMIKYYINLKMLKEVNIYENNIWTKEEDDQLINEYKNNLSIEKISKIHKRSNVAIVSRIKLLNLDNIVKFSTDEEIYKYIEKNNINNLVDYIPRNVGGKYDTNSNLIIGVKEKQINAIKYFLNILLKWVEKNIKNHEKIVIAVVPGHLSSKINDSGVAIIAQEVIKKYKMVNGINLIFRNKDMPKKATSKIRTSLKEDIESISLNNTINIKQKTILLLDDVTTTGNSLKACSYILLKNGAYDVIPLALGKTVKYYER